MIINNLKVVNSLKVSRKKNDFSLRKSLGLLYSTFNSLSGGYVDGGLCDCT